MFILSYAFDVLKVLDLRFRTIQPNSVTGQVIFDDLEDISGEAPINN